MDKIVPPSDKLEKSSTYAPKKNKHMSGESNIFNTIMITRRVPVNILYIGRNIMTTLERVISANIEGKCIVEGYIKPGSVRILTYSSGIIYADNVHYEVVFECEACKPVEGMSVKCIVKNVTKAGIRAEIDSEKSPLVVFVARDHHDITPYFSSLKEKDSIKVRVIGQRFELNDKYISVIADIITPNEPTDSPPPSPPSQFVETEAVPADALSSVDAVPAEAVPAEAVPAAAVPEVGPTKWGDYESETPPKPIVEPIAEPIAPPQQSKLKITVKKSAKKTRKPKLIIKE